MSPSLRFATGCTRRFAPCSRRFVPDESVEPLDSPSPASTNKKAAPWALFGDFVDWRIGGGE